VDDSSNYRATQRIRERKDPITVIVNVTFPPWPAPPAAPEPPPAPPTSAPLPLPVPEPDPAPAPPVVKENWINRWLGHIWLELGDDARWFYKQVRFWLFAVVTCAPDLYNLAVDNHMLPGGHVPAPLERFFNVIGFLGAATVLVKAKKKQQDDD